MTIQLLLIALCIALEPLPLTGFIVTLATENGLKNGAGFLLGWIVTLIGVVVLVVAGTGGTPPASSSAPSNAVLVVKLLLGLALLLFAWSYRRRPAKPTKDPKWMAKMDTLRPPAAAFLAFLLQPWGLVAAGAATITQANTSSAGDVATLVAFVVLASAPLVAMELYAWRSPTAARRRLDGLRNWMATHQRAMVIYLALIIGALLVSTAVAGLS